MAACPLREPMMVASRELRYSTSLERAMTYLSLVITTPQGTGDPTNLWPDTETEPMGFLKVTMGALLQKGIIRPNRAPSQWIKNRSSVYPVCLRMSRILSRSSTAPLTVVPMLTFRIAGRDLLAAREGPKGIEKGKGQREDEVDGRMLHT